MGFTGNPAHNAKRLRKAISGEMDKMEIIMITAKLKQTATIFILALSIVQPISAMWLAKTTISGACTLANWGLTVFPALSTILDSWVSDVHVKKNKETVSNVPESIINLVKKEVENHSINNVKCISSGNRHDYSTYDPLKILYMPDKKIAELLPLLQKEKLTKKEQATFNFHRADINHELEHIRRQSSLWHDKYIPIAATVVTQGAAMCFKPFLNWLFPLTRHSFILNNTIKIIGGTAKLGIIFALMHLSKKYEELKADDGIPDEEKLLAVSAEYYEKRFEDKMKNVHFINNIPLSKLLSIKMKRKHTDKREKEIDNDYTIPQILAIKAFGPERFSRFPILSDIFFKYYRNGDHPSDLRRSIRLRDRIKKLKANQKM